MTEEKNKACFLFGENVPLSMPLLHVFLFGGEVAVDRKEMEGVSFCTQQYALNFSKFTVDLPDSSEEMVSLLTKLLSSFLIFYMGF